jgi:hypothetical protein
MAPLVVVLSGHASHVTDPSSGENCSAGHSSQVELRPPAENRPALRSHGNNKARVVLAAPDDWHVTTWVLGTLAPHPAPVKRPETTSLTGMPCSHRGLRQIQARKPPLRMDWQHQLVSMPMNSKVNWQLHARWAFDADNMKARAILPIPRITQWTPCAVARPLSRLSTATWRPHTAVGSSGSAVGGGASRACFTRL